MNELEIFNNQEFGQIRATEINGEPYFVGKDIAEALGYSNTNDAISKHIDDEDKKFLTSQNATFDVPNRGMTVINESGVYALVFSSKLPNAKQFKHWVTSEVLPTIRKHGAYATPATIESIIADPDNGIKLLTALKEEQEKRKELEAKNAEMKPKALFAEAVTASKTSILVGELAKILKQNGIATGQKRLFQWMRDNGYLIKSGSATNMPTQKSMDKGLFEIKETTITNPDGSVRITKTPKITGRGQVFFINLFKGDNSNEAH